MIYKNESPNSIQIPDRISSQTNFIFRVRMIWRDLASWLRAYKTSLYGGVGNTEELSRRLFRMPTEYGNILKVFFGDQTVEPLMFLLTQYIAVLQSLFNAQIAQDIHAVNDFTQQAYNTVYRTSELLATSNPYWTRGDWIALLSSFTAMQIEEATTFLTEEHTKNIDIFDRLLSLSNIIGDYFAEGMTDYFILIQRRAT